MNQKGLSREESVRIEAYLLSERAGHPSGMESVFWHEAEALVSGRSASKLAPKRKAVSKTAAKGKVPKIAPAKTKAAVAKRKPAPVAIKAKGKKNV